MGLDARPRLLCARPRKRGFGMPSLPDAPATKKAPLCGAFQGPLPSAGCGQSSACPPGLGVVAGMSSPQLPVQPAGALFEDDRYCE